MSLRILYQKEYWRIIFIILRLMVQLKMSLTTECSVNIDIQSYHYQSLFLSHYRHRKKRLIVTRRFCHMPIGLKTPQSRLQICPKFTRICQKVKISLPKWMHLLQIYALTQCIYQTSLGFLMEKETSLYSARKIRRYFPSQENQSRYKVQV